MCHVKPASRQSVDYTLGATVEDNEAADPPTDGRSPFMWIRLPNGDLILGVFPYGDTYFATENDHP